MDLLGFVIFVIIVAILSAYIIEFITRGKANFSTKANFFCRKFIKNSDSTREKLKFIDLFFLTFEDYLSHFFLLEPNNRNSLRNYITENFNKDQQNEYNIKSMIADILIGEFMKKKKYVTGESWISSTNRKSGLLNEKAQRAAESACDKYQMEGYIK